MTTMAEEARHYILTVACASARGQVAALSGFLHERSCYISKFAQFDDATTHRFFARCLFRADPQGTPPLERLRREFASGPAARWDMDWALADSSARRRVLIAVSKFDHCLNDLLYRHRVSELRMDVSAVVSNHPDLEPLARRHGIPFVHLPVTPDTKAAQEARLWELIEETGSELVVLASYMQVLSDALCGRLCGRAIDIHHSFLPGFKGAKPYQRAHERGVKLIGATAHYVTADLDDPREGDRAVHFAPPRPDDPAASVEQFLSATLTWFGCVREKGRRETEDGPKWACWPVPVVRINGWKGSRSAGFRPSAERRKRISRLVRLAEREGLSSNRLRAPGDRQMVADASSVR